MEPVQSQGEIISEGFSIERQILHYLGVFVEGQEEPLRSMCVLVVLATLEASFM